MRFARLALLFLLVPFAAAAADPAGTRYFTASTEGTLTVGTDGRVAEVVIEPRQLGREAIDAITQVARAWRFEPIVANGRPVAVSGRMRLDLLAAEIAGEDGVQIALRKVHFLAPAGADAPTDRRPAIVSPLTAPRYPVENAMAGVGGHVMLTLRLGADGTVADVAADHVLLLGDPSVATASNLQAHVRRFVVAAREAAGQWRFGTEGERTVRVPIRFRPAHFTDERWTRTRVFALPPPAWLLAERAGRPPGTFDPEPVAIDERFRLLTPALDRLVPGG